MLVKVVSYNPISLRQSGRVMTLVMASRLAFAIQPQIVGEPFHVQQVMGFSLFHFGYPKGGNTHTVCAVGVAQRVLKRGRVVQVS